MMSAEITPELIEKIRLGNKRALFLLYKKFYTPLFQFINRQIRDTNVTEELVQDVFLGCIDGIRERRNITSFSAYIYTIARYKTIDYIRKKKIKKIFFSTLPESIIERGASLLFKEKMERAEISDLLERVFQNLPHEYSLIIRLKYIDGYTVQKIAQKLKVNFKAAESMLYRARKAFSKLYSHLNA